MADEKASAAKPRSQAKKSPSPKAPATPVAKGDAGDAVEAMCCRESRQRGPATAGGGMVYVTGLIGSAVFYIQESTGFGEFIVACLKALVWPAFVVYELLKHMA